MSADAIRTEFELPQIQARRQRQLAAAGNGTDAQPPPPSPEMQARNNQVLLELGEQKLLRAIYSDRQLQEVMTDFWFNHFNVDARKGRDRFLLTTYEREAIRPHVLGRFRDLLEATAKSPAMLFYLDNWMSADPDALPPGRRAGLLPAKRQRQGLNENYGRELMELHTLGVDARHTAQRDVTDVARAFTGLDDWQPASGRRLHLRRAPARSRGEAGARPPNQGGRRRERRRTRPRHPRRASLDGALHLDQAGPGGSSATRRRRRWSIVPRPDSSATDGDIAEVMRTILTSPEFLATDGVSREGQVAVRIHRERGAGHRIRGTGRRAAGSRAAAAWHAALRLSAADRLQGHRRRLGQHGRSRQQDEHRACAREQSNARDHV